ncbi:Aspartyl/glutamyl-tRNA(Asn/Gln) amidotransferase subunit B [uncultured archaeon]|nr:Aspartyl/glutamyl-tRNA(Asn/Gln) amidotransferase subunit B [uncultured archaeon]
MRVDANISLKGGYRAEVKNISGFKGVEKALSYEITRQKNLQRRSIKVVQETRHFDEIRNITVSIRSKVGAHDYRYFPECDLVTLRIASWVPAIRAALPELPDAKRERFVRQYALSDDHAKSLTSEIKIANFYEAVAAAAAPKLAAVWIADVLKGELNYRNLGIDAFREEHMVEIVKMLDSREITEDGAVQIIRDLLDKNGESPGGIVKSKGLGKAGDDAVKIAVQEAVAENAAAVADYKAGSERALNFIVGVVMKKTRGKADPGEVHKLVKVEVEKV